MRPILILFVLLTGCGPAAFVTVAEQGINLEELESDSAASLGKNLDVRIQDVLDSGRDRRRMSSTRNAAWQIMHGVICYGRDLQIDTPDRGETSAVDYAFSNGLIRGFELMPAADILRSTGRRGLKARLNPGSFEGQGHVDQWLAIFAMADLPLDTKIQVGDQQFVLMDLARQAQYDVPNNLLDEFSWTLIAMTHYFPDQPRWPTSGNTEVSWELLVEAELTYDIDLSPCGGTHRLAGIVRALNGKKRLGLPDSEVWNEAQLLVDRLYTNAKEFRSPNGSLSSFYFTSPGNTVDLATELSSTGHVFEFVALAASDDELDDPWIALTASRLCELLEATDTIELDCGALYHALNGLKIYQQRRFRES